MHGVDTRDAQEIGNKQIEGENLLLVAQSKLHENKAGDSQKSRVDLDSLAHATAELLSRKKGHVLRDCRRSSFAKQVSRGDNCFTPQSQYKWCHGEVPCWLCTNRIQPISCQKSACAGMDGPGKISENQVSLSTHPSYFLKKALML